MPKSRVTRRALIAGAAPLVAAAPLTKLALASTNDGPEHDASHLGHDHAASGHAAMIGRPCPPSAARTTSTRCSIPPPALPHEPGPRARVHADATRPRHRGRAGRLLPRLDVQRHRARAGDPRDRGRPAARALRQRRLAPAHDPLPRHPPGEHGRRLRDRRPGRASSPTSSRRGRTACTSTTATRRR